MAFPDIRRDPPLALRNSDLAGLIGGAGRQAFPALE